MFFPRKPSRPKKWVCVSCGEPLARKPKGRYVLCKSCHMKIYLENRRAERNGRENAENVFAVE
jgi:DNA-directed RNA polymerase subunit RPC12/RpoP